MSNIQYITVPKKGNDLMKKVLAIIQTTLLFLLVSCNTTSSSTTEPLEKVTKHPIFIAHGLFERADIPYPNSSTRLVNLYNEHDIEAFSANTDSLGTIEDNGEIIFRQVKEFLKNNPRYDKVNIVAFSKGGIESRYAISTLGLGPYVASLITISTPHRGTKAAEFFTNTWATSNIFTSTFINWAVRILGDNQPDYKEAIKSLTRENMFQFNMENPNHNNVQYFSFGADMTTEYNHIFFGPLRDFLLDEEGPSDGVVSIASSKWGEYKGTVNDFVGFTGGIAHADIVGLNLPSNKNFDSDDFFLKIVQFLVEKNL